jgi:hypothetical protein
MPHPAALPPFAPARGRACSILVQAASLALAYRYKLIEGAVPKSGGATALFIDWIGVGGGVGPGFHGVGVGARGVGWR